MDDADDAKVDAAKVAEPHYLGHRQRLRQRFLKGGALPEYELLEILLWGANARGDTKPLAKALIARFGSLAGVVSAPAEALAAVKGCGEAAIAQIKAARAAALALVRAEAAERPIIGTQKELVAYCRAAIARDANEQMRVLFLDRKNRLLADEAQQTGTVDQAPLYPREVVKRALELGASALILVHNHPSGDATPSGADIEVTRQVRQAAAALGLKLHDHIIVARKEHASFRALGLL
jgi:DNA repair protein RadC